MQHSLSGIHLKNHLVASSSPLTESLERTKCCRDAHFAAAILKSCADYRRKGSGYGRKVVYTEDGYYADGSFEGEIMTLDEGTELFIESQNEVGKDMLLIPSVSASSLEIEDWFSICRHFQNLGAKLIQLDFFYLGSLNHDTEFYENLRDLLMKLINSLDCAIMPKLNLKFEPDWIFPLLKDCGIKTVSLLDSMREDLDEKYGLHKGNTSYFGHREFPYTLVYLRKAKEYGLEVCAGGGVSSKKDVDLLIENGADAVQVASYVLTRDFSSVKNLIPEYENYDFTYPCLSHNPWCDENKCISCGGCHKVSY